ncbi:MAG: sugar transferase [Selenomonas sp.]|nr:sugar transferase [Selenomonas sp.]
MDLTGAGLGLIILSPLFLLVAFAIRQDSPGPVLFRQRRLTKDGRCFEMLKFRSMYVDSEKRGTGLFNYKDDPRVTRVGRKLRDSSIDELPQLINVLRGELSLVGPRPPVTYELGNFATLNIIYKKRFRMNAGITGLAQVEGRNDISWDEKVHYDNDYIDGFQRQGIWLDLQLLLKTFFNVFASKNIYEEKFDDSMSSEEAAMVENEEVIRIAHLSEEEYKHFEEKKYGDRYQCKQM